MDIMDNCTRNSGLKMFPRMEAVTSGGVARWRPDVRHKVVTPAPGSAHSPPPAPAAAVVKLRRCCLVKFKRFKVPSPAAAAAPVF